MAIIHFFVDFRILLLHQEEAEDEAEPGVEEEAEDPEDVDVGAAGAGVEGSQLLLRMLSKLLLWLRLELFQYGLLWITIRIYNTLPFSITMGPQTTLE